MGGTKAPAPTTDTTSNAAPTTSTTGNTAPTTGTTGNAAATSNVSPTTDTTSNAAPTTSTTGNTAPTSTTNGAPTMSKQQISQWISRNSEDAESLKAFLDGTAPKTSAPSPDFSKTLTGYKKPTMNVPTGIPTTSTMMPSNMIGSKPPAPATAPTPKEDSQAEIKKALDARRAAGLMAEGKRK
jgi:hypothetical protein